ncbi:hypothetical protein BVI1335_1360010 [Burkholderia vietnamiensis]|nr:hypothetical protein BVI1335_1360010 [Burkholderia vietnamiensis]
MCYGPGLAEIPRDSGIPALERRSQPQTPRHRQNRAPSARKAPPVGRHIRMAEGAERRYPAKEAVGSDGRCDGEGLQSGSENWFPAVRENRLDIEHLNEATTNDAIHDPRRRSHDRGRNRPCNGNAVRAWRQTHRS